MPTDILAVFAHPDDESWIIGGTAAKYRAYGIRTVLVCATRGEASALRGEATSPEDLADLREAELHCACRTIGIDSVLILGLPDGRGMDWDEERVSAELVRVIRSYRPRTVVTWAPHGDGGHPDHVAIARLTKSSYLLSGTSHAVPDQLRKGLEPHAAERLYYSAGLPASRAAPFLELLRTRGLTDGSVDRLRTLLVDPDDAVTTVVDVGGHVDTKLAALACHQSQYPSGALSDWPADVVRGVLRYECFRRYEPLPHEGLEAGILADAARSERPDCVSTQTNE